MQLLKRLLVIILVVALVAIPINDLVRFLGAFYSLDNVTRAAALTAAEQAKRSRADRTGPGTAAVEYAAARGVHVSGYDQDQSKVTVWTDAPVPGTLAWGPLTAAFARKPFKQWWASPPLIRAKAEALIL
jgi:hypothetical protein